MMFWNGHDPGGWGWFGMSVGTLVFWALTVTAVVLIFRAFPHPPEPSRSSAPAAPERLLAERFARGEIDEDEYRGRLAVLHTADPLTKR
ncbi:SHOCT domain-containing protein [Streptomyces sp. Q6]|uniref:SHOCT domain-containing protein n=1 Tax=Streptomyces citrinus TaxID=3118173 RepID=A0ACD5AM35_9ACTN